MRCLMIVVLGTLTMFGCASERSRQAVTQTRESLQTLPLALPADLQAQLVPGLTALVDQLAQVERQQGSPKAPLPVIDFTRPTTDQVGTAAGMINAEKLRATNDARGAVLAVITGALERGARTGGWIGAACGLGLALWQLIAKRKVRELADKLQDAAVGMVHSGMELRDRARAGEVLNEQTIKNVLDFWNATQDAKGTVGKLLAEVKTAWGSPAAPAPTTTTRP